MPDLKSKSRARLHRRTYAKLLPPGGQRWCSEQQGTSSGAELSACRLGYPAPRQPPNSGPGTPLPVLAGGPVSSCTPYLRALGSLGGAGEGERRVLLPGELHGSIKLLGGGKKTCSSSSQRPGGTPEERSSPLGALIPLGRKAGRGLGPFLPWFPGSAHSQMPHCHGSLCAEQFCKGGWRLLL